MGRLCLLWTLALVCGCTAINAFDDPALVGEWRSAGTIAGLRNALSVELDGSGDATLYVGSDDPATPHRFDFDVEWTQRGPERFRLELDCAGSPIGVDCTGFILTCNVAADETDMRCNGSDGWASYTFAWEAR